MATIEVAKHSGFCFGVRRAIDIAKEVAAKHAGETTYVYGQLVHNERVIDDLQKQGIVFVEEMQNIPSGATTVLRAHGEPGTTYQELGQKGISTSTTLTDATCPLVTLVHNVAIKLKAAGYEVAIFGKHDHPESIGTSYHIRGKDTFIIEKPTLEYAQKFVEYLKKNNIKKAALVSQTTMSVYGYKQLIDNLNKLTNGAFRNIPLSLTDLSADYGFVDTICNPTKQRQSGTEELAKRVEVMVVIGGVHSSNARELAEKSRQLGVETYYVQNASQVEKKWFDGKERIGVSAGASTPDILIDEVVGRIKELTA
jgi:4-hydroxy-3-methylbut-2-enyl diphosphate reductase